MEETTSGRGYVLLAVLVFLITSMFAIALHRDPWFDVSFSLETAHQMNEGRQIDFAEYDVHPPLYYKMLAVWQSARAPIFSEYVWAQLLSVLFGVVFIGFVTAGLKRVFGDPGGVAGIILATISTYVHTFTEVRMYAPVLAASAIAFYYIFSRREDMKKNPWLFLWASIAIGVLPLLHYLAGIASLFFIASFIILSASDEKRWWKDKKSKKGSDALYIAIFFCSVLLIASSVAAGYALSQRARMESMWFQGNTVADGIGAMVYPFVFVDSGLSTTSSTFIALLSVVVLALIWGAILYGFWRLFTVKKQKMELVLMFATAAIPFAWLLFVQFSSLSMNLYHHRFFLVIMWMFAAAVIVSLLQSNIKWQSPALAVFILVLISLYALSVNHDVQDIAYATPCESITIVHESPWSAIPFTVLARERGCAWRNVLSTELTPRQGASAGFDAIPEENILYGRSVPEGDYYVADSTGVIPLDGLTSVEYIGNGIRLVKVTR